MFGLSCEGPISGWQRTVFVPTPHSQRQFFSPTPSGATATAGALGFGRRARFRAAAIQLRALNTRIPQARHCLRSQPTATPLGADARPPRPRYNPRIANVSQPPHCTVPRCGRDLA